MGIMEISYLKALIKQLNPQGNVLQVGFHSDVCVQEIQKYQPKSYTLIETDAEKIARAKKWSSTLTPIESLWEEALPKLGVFDTLLFTSSLQPQEVIQDTSYETTKNSHISPSSQVGMNALSFGHGNITIEAAEKMFPDLSSIQYSDEDLDEFLKTIPFSIEHIIPFLDELKVNGQITENQLKAFLRKHQKTAERALDPLILFLQTCLKNHMHSKSLASWITPSLTSKYDCPDFFEQIIMNPEVTYEEYPDSSSEEMQLMMVLHKTGPSAP